jgi:type VI secretion system protein ImpK
MSDNPFNEPQDDERTILRLPKGGRVAPAAGPAAPAAALPDAPTAVPQVGRSAVLRAATPLLDLLARIGSRSTPVQDAQALRERAILALQAFDADCRAAGVPADQLRAAHYALCVALDDTALATPWGQSSSWAANSLGSTFHHDVRGGERFFAMLDGLQKEAARFHPVLEICYLCLSLGFKGRYRLDPRGGTELERIRENLFQHLRQLGGPAESGLSPQWKGVDAPHRGPDRRVPAWAIAAVALSVLALGYAGLSRWASVRGDDLQARMVQLPPSQPATIQRAVAAVVPPAMPASAGDLAARFRGFLQPEIERGLVTVQGDAQRLMVRILSRGMFESGSAQVQPGAQPLLQRVGQALREEPGRVLVVGHSDNQPIRSVRFPSNFELSAARADAARQLLAGASGQPERFTSAGRADTEPLGSNATPEGRDANRRIEIVLTRAEGR